MDMVMVRELAEIIGLFAGIIGVAGGFWLYFKKEGFKNFVDKVLPFLPFLLSFAASRTKDEIGVFDNLDAFVVLGRLMEHIRETIIDPSNTNFEDVEEELYEFVTAELERYNSLGIKNVPDIDDEAVRLQVRIAFESIQRVLSGEAPTGNDN